MKYIRAAYSRHYARSHLRRRSGPGGATNTVIPALTPTEEGAVNHLPNAPGATPGEPRTIRPELAARITAASAVVADFTRQSDDWIAGRGDQPFWQDFAWRLHTELRSLLALIGDTTS